MTTATRERVHTFLVMKQAGKPDRIFVWDTQDVSIGRSPENDIAVEDGELSRRHAEFSRVGDAYRVTDLGTSNGTFVGGQRISVHELSNKDIVKIADLEIHFYRAARNPASLGSKVEYTSQLKEFSLPGGAVQDGEATMLGLAEPIASPDEDDFEVRPANDFEYDLHGIDDDRPRPTRNLDLEIEAPGGGEPVAPTAGPPPQATAAAEPWILDDEAAQPARLSVHLEVEGLPPELRRRVEALLGKVIQLPALRIRLKPDDLG